MFIILNRSTISKNILHSNLNWLYKKLKKKFNYISLILQSQKFIYLYIRYKLIITFRKTFNFIKKKNYPSKFSRTQIKSKSRLKYQLISRKGRKKQYLYSHNSKTSFIFSRHQLNSNRSITFLLSFHKTISPVSQFRGFVILSPRIIESNPFSKQLLSNFQHHRIINSNNALSLSRSESTFATAATRSNRNNIYIKRKQRWWRLWIARRRFNRRSIGCSRCSGTGNKVQSADPVPSARFFLDPVPESAEAAVNRGSSIGADASFHGGDTTPRTRESRRRHGHGHKHRAAGHIPRHVPHAGGRLHLPDHRDFRPVGRAKYHGTEQNCREPREEQRCWGQDSPVRHQEDGREGER